MKLKTSSNFKKAFEKLDKSYKEKVEKQIRKIIENPLVGKPMRYNRKSTREVYVPPFRLSYSYFNIKDEIFIYELYHKKKQ